MNLVALPAFADNCPWMLHDGRRAFALDPDDAASALGIPGRLALSGILVTQHPRDQRERFPEIASHAKGPAHGDAPQRMSAPATFDPAGLRELRNRLASP